MNVMHCDRKVRQEGNSKVRKKGRGLSAEGLDPQEINVCRCPSTITPHLQLHKSENFTSRLL